MPENDQGRGLPRPRRARVIGEARSSFLYCTHCRSSECEHIGQSLVHVTRINEQQRDAFLSGFIAAREIEREYWRSRDRDPREDALGTGPQIVIDDATDASQPERDPQAPRICVNCLHHRSGIGGHFCADERGTKLDLVTGEERPVKAALTDCQDERGNAQASDFATYGYEKCGSEGLHFVQRAVDNTGDYMPSEVTINISAPSIFSAVDPSTVRAGTWQGVIAGDAPVIGGYVGASGIGRLTGTVNESVSYAGPSRASESGGSIFRYAGVEQGQSLPSRPMTHVFSNATDRCEYCDALRVDVEDGTTSSRCRARF